MNRKISLYYASISPFEMLWCFIKLFVDVWRSPISLRQRVVFELSKIFGLRRYYLFSSARGALSFYLKTMLTPGDEVIISSYTCLAVPTAIIAANMKPIYIDINPESLAIDERALLTAVNKNTKAIVLQHTLGNIMPLSSVLKECRKRGILVIEDCALSIGTKLNGNYMGSFGDASIFSMELSKTVSCGWGGILQINATLGLNDIDLAYERVNEQNWLLSARDFFQTFLASFFTDPRVLGCIGKYLIWLCYKLRLFRYSTPDDEVNGCFDSQFVSKMGWAQMILAAAQWRRFAVISTKCTLHFKLIASALEQAGFTVHRPNLSSIEPVSNRVSFIAKNKIAVIEQFASNGIELGMWFDGPLSPLPKDSIFQYSAQKYPMAVSVSRSVLNIPCHSRLSDIDITKIIKCISSLGSTQEPNHY